MMSGSLYTKRNKDTKFEVDKDGEECGANAKIRLAFTDTIELDPLVSELMSRTRGGTRTDLRSGAGITGLVDFRDAGPFDIEWRLQGFLPTTVEKEVMAELIKI